MTLFQYVIFSSIVFCIISAIKWAADACIRVKFGILGGEARSAHKAINCAYAAAGLLLLFFAPVKEIVFQPGLLTALYVIALLALFYLGTINDRLTYVAAAAAILWPFALEYLWHDGLVTIYGGVIFAFFYCYGLAFTNQFEHERRDRAPDQSEIFHTYEQVSE